MNTKMNELNLNEMEQVNGGFDCIDFASSVVMSLKGLVYIGERIHDCVTGKAKSPTLDSYC